jgi:hypothetical protein
MARDRLWEPRSFCSRPFQSSMSVVFQTVTGQIAAFRMLDQLITSAPLCCSTTRHVLC